MAQTKLEVAQRALRVLYPATNDDSKTSLREMVYAVANARDSLIVNDFLSRLQTDFDLVDDGWLKEYSENPQYSDARCSWYVQLPVNVVTLPNDMGIYYVTDCNNLDDPYIPVKKSHRWSYAGSPAEDLEGSASYYREGNKIWLNVGKDFLSKNDTIKLTLITAGSDIDEDDPEFGVSESFTLDIIQAAVSLYMITKQLPEDTTNNRLSDR